MKFNWKILFGLVVLVAAAFWAIDSVRTRSYGGSALNFGVGSGLVSLTNPSEETVSVQLVGTGTRSFMVTSSAEDAAGSSTREGSGRSATQMFELALPPGETEFTVTRGTDVKFIAGDTSLQAVVQPLNADNSQTTLVVAVIAILGALFYLSSASGHPWMKLIRRQKSSVRETQPNVAVSVSEA